jgi:hypothetical protein
MTTHKSSQKNGSNPQDRETRSSMPSTVNDFNGLGPSQQDSTHSLTTGPTYPKFPPMLLTDWSVEGPFQQPRAGDVCHRLLDAARHRPSSRGYAATSLGQVAAEPMVSGSEADEESKT